jgi:hypothetical protein
MFILHFNTFCRLLWVNYRYKSAQLLGNKLKRKKQGIMKRNTPTQKKVAGKKRGKKAVADPFTEMEGMPYTGTLNKQRFTTGKSTWDESRRNEKTWDILFETVAVKPFEGAVELPVGSEHHSYVLAHQTLVKTRKNTYSLKLQGIKFKLAHKQAGGSWNANALARKNQLIKILKTALHELEMGHGQAPAISKKTYGANGVSEE